MTHENTRGASFHSVLLSALLAVFWLSGTTAAFSIESRIRTVRLLQSSTSNDGLHRHAISPPASERRRRHPTKSRLYSTPLNMNDGNSSILNRGKTLGSQQILNPEIYLSDLTPPPIEEDPIPLFTAIQSLIKSLKKIIEAAEAYKTNDDISNDQRSLLSYLDSTKILRIEESISAVHTVDPLCWLHAQQSSMRNLRHKLSREGTSLPVIYFGDAEGQVEAAVIGKVSNSYSDSWDPFVGKRIWDDEGANNQQQHSMFKESDLPIGARVYGGSRFDHEFYQQKIRQRKKGMFDDDWDGFGGDRGGFWILPAVELRREMIDMAMSCDESSIDSAENREARKLTLAIHLHNSALPGPLDSKQSRQFRHRIGWYDSAKRTLMVLQELSDQLSPSVPCTTLPPVLTRSESAGKGGESGGDGDPGYVFERGVTEALKRITSPGVEMPNSDSLRKVVLARKVDLNLGAPVSGLDVLMRLKFGGHIGHIFYLNPGDDEAASASQYYDGIVCSREFLGCAPERLFRVKGQGMRKVQSEALAGTRIRGLTPAADAELLRELLSSKKDMLENEITGKFISDALQELELNGWLKKNKDNDLLKPYEFNGISNEMKLDSGSAHRRRFFVRRLRHLQHICQTFEGELSEQANVIDVSRSLLSSLHPTPAVCGDSPDVSLDFIRQFETIASYDRGYFAGPFGFIGHDSADVIVAIRSGLVTNYYHRPNTQIAGGEIDANTNPESKISVFAGAGVVEGSTVQGEWTETSHKLGVISSLFPSSPITLQSYSSPNVAWSSAFIEELVRCGITTFYICPGSRNTPLTTAIFKATRLNTGVVRAISVHDERGAGFRALGYARQNRRPAAVVTSSGTAVANLYPSVVEASSDGVPLLLLTADRPYESRDTGSNQAIDQVKIFSSSYVRWFRDIPAPSDDVPVSLALSDANHAVSLTKQLMGPVHLNIQFRENLAPDDGPIRNDARVGSVTKFYNARFTDIPGFTRWSLSGRRWLETYHSSGLDAASVMEVSELILQSRRGVIVTGNLRSSGIETDIARFAKATGIPVLAGVQSGALRKELPVMPYAEHVLKNPVVSNEMQPDLILQLGCPLISTEIQQMITKAMRKNPSTKHVLVQQLYSYERADPEQTVTHRISANIGQFLRNVMDHLDNLGTSDNDFGSELAPLLYLGRDLRVEMPALIRNTSPTLDSLDSSKTSINGEQEELNQNDDCLTEPQIMQAIMEVLAETSSMDSAMSLFLSNSMPVRDGEFFLYPSMVTSTILPTSVSVNRGASGIDGIISTAIGCADSFKPTTLVCGDVTTLHDLNAFYGLTSDPSSQPNASNLSRIPLTTVVVNNGGGAIFSFLPIAKHGQDVGFDEYWGTPTDKYDFQKGASAFGLPYKSASSFQSFKDAYKSSILSGNPTIIEAKVTTRSTNVGVHQAITRGAVDFVNKVLSPKLSSGADNISRSKLPIKQYNCELIQSSSSSTEGISKTLLLLHGWMGDKTDWDLTANALSTDLSGEWNIVSIDLPGHGDAPIMLSSNRQIVHSSLGLGAPKNTGVSTLTLDEMARSVCRSLVEDHDIRSIDAIAGYSLGGRVALAMKRCCSSMPSGQETSVKNIVTDQTQMILLGSDPQLPKSDDSSTDRTKRKEKDFALAEDLIKSSYRSYLMTEAQDMLCLRNFLRKWYSSDLWGDLRNRKPQEYQSMISRRLDSLAKRRHDFAAVLKGCSPPLTTQGDWKTAVPSKTLFVAGARDQKYSSIGRRWRELNGISKYVELPDAGHALLVEDPFKIATIIGGFVNNQAFEEPSSSDQGATSTFSPSNQNAIVAERRSDLPSLSIGSLEYESFGITMTSADGDEGVRGVGWGDSARTENIIKKREGIIISLTSSDGAAVGIGEVSPLKGLHTESLEDAEQQLLTIKKYFNVNSVDTSFHGILSLDGSLTEFVDKVFVSSGIEHDAIAQSVRYGLEMAVLSIASQICGSPLPRALAMYDNPGMQTPNTMTFELLPVNGLVTRGSKSSLLNDISFPSIKVKVGDKDPLSDAQNFINIKTSGSRHTKLRADANRAWSIQSARSFIEELKKLDDSSLDMIEFIEEPLEKQGEVWSLKGHVNALEGFTGDTGVLYALDESLVDLAQAHQYNFDDIASDLRATFRDPKYGCAGFVLKPAMLGVELSMQIARLAQKEFKIPAVFSSSFDSGIGLSYTSILAAVADKSSYAHDLTKYSHGLGTFTMLAGDILSPPFESYVNKDGMLNVDSLARAIYGLSLDEISDRLPTSAEFPINEPSIVSSTSKDYSATTSSSTGRDITVSVSMPLPFSDGVANSRFTDLPQMSRWSPWLNSVTYLDEKGLTEWNLNIKGVKFSWKAQSEVLNAPKGIKWQSISGLRNSGMVTFEPVTSDSCVMKLKMSIIMPFILVSLFQGMPSVVHDFLQNKLLKWSLEMFRDVVKADLALERGDNELGDALFSAVEGRSNALEEALK